MWFLSSTVSFAIPLIVFFFFYLSCVVMKLPLLLGIYVSLTCGVSIHQPKLPEHVGMLGVPYSLLTPLSAPLSPLSLFFNHGFLVRCNLCWGIDNVLINDNALQLECFWGGGAGCTRSPDNGRQMATADGLCYLPVGSCIGLKWLAAECTTAVIGCDALVVSKSSDV